jgi:hypothetical protein
MLTGYAGRVDGTNAIRHATINFVGDGTLLASHELNANDLPTPISVFVEGINLLRIEMIIHAHRTVENGATHYAFVGYLE